MRTVHGAPAPHLLRWAVAFAVAFAVFSVVAVRTHAGQHADIEVFVAVQALGDTVEYAASWLRAGLPMALALVCLPLVVRAVRAGRWHDVAGAAVIVVVSFALTTVLRLYLIDRPNLGDLGYPENTLPSGHVSAAAGLAIAAVLLWPAATRRLAALGAGVVIAVACLASVVGYAHRPSDVVASVLLVGAVACATTALPRPGSSRVHP